MSDFMQLSSSLQDVTMKLWTERLSEMAKFFGKFMTVFIANAQKVKLITHLGIKAYEEVEK